MAETDTIKLKTKFLNEIRLVGMLRPVEQLLVKLALNKTVGGLFTKIAPNNYQYSKDIIINYSPLNGDINKKIMRNLHKIFLSHLLRLIFKKGKPWLALNLFLQMQKGKA